MFKLNYSIRNNVVHSTLHFVTGFKKSLAKCYSFRFSKDLSNAMHIATDFHCDAQLQKSPFVITSVYSMYLLCQLG